MTESVKKALWLSLGLLSTLLGIIGIALPLLPTTPFLLLAAYSFAQSSERMHRWLAEHHAFGPIISNWQEHGAIDRRSKIIALSMIACAPIITFFLQAPLWALASQIAVLSIVSLFILTRPES